MGGGHFQPKVTMYDEKCVTKLGTDDMGELRNRGQGGREIGDSFAEVAMRTASKDIQFFPHGVRERHYLMKTVWKRRQVGRVLGAFSAQLSESYRIKAEMGKMGNKNESGAEVTQDNLFFYFFYYLQIGLKTFKTIQEQVDYH